MAFIVPVLVALGSAVTAGAATGTAAAVIGGGALALGTAKGVMAITDSDKVKAPGETAIASSDINKRSQALRMKAAQRAQDKFSREDTILGGGQQQQSTFGGGTGKSLLGE